MPIPAAAGYPQYSNSLTTPLFRMDLLERFYATTVYSDISTTEYSGELEKSGDQITFQREPKVIIRDYQKNGKIIHDTMDGEPVTMTIDKAKTFSVKMNKIDQKQIQNFDRWKAGIMKSAAMELARVIDPEVMTEMWTGTALYNQGADAGLVSGDINMGTPGTPLHISNTNFNTILQQIHQVLDEAAAPQDGRFLVLPPVGYTALATSEVRLAYASGIGESPLLNGKLPSEVGGFTILRSLNVPSVIDGSVRAYHMVAGVKMATAFAAQIQDSRVISDKDDWADYYQGLSVYGFKVLYPDALVHIYANFV